MAVPAVLPLIPGSEVVRAPQRRRPLNPDVELALRLMLHACAYGHHVCCGGQPGNLFDRALADVELLTGLRAPGAGPRPDMDAVRADIERRLGRME